MCDRIPKTNWPKKPECLSCVEEKGSVMIWAGIRTPQTTEESQKTRFARMSEKRSVFCDISILHDFDTFIVDFST